MDNDNLAAARNPKLVELERQLEAKAAGRAQSPAVREGQRNPVQETGSGTAVGLHIQKAEPGAARVDQLFPHRQHESLAEERF